MIRPPVTRPLLRAAAIAALLVAGIGPARGFEVTLSLGRNDILDRLGDPSFVAGLGIASDPLGRWGSLGLAVGGGVEVGASGSFWAGAGPILLLPFGDGWRLGLSVMPGAYNQGNGVDLGFPLEFRSRLGLSRQVGPDWSVGLAIEHKSNADLSESNPGVETLILTVARRF
ncbi:MAG: acyloxyacyl hydrolase [Amaricoccus sp.]